MNVIERRNRGSENESEKTNASYLLFVVFGIGINSLANWITKTGTATRVSPNAA